MEACGQMQPALTTHAAGYCIAVPALHPAPKEIQAKKARLQESSENSDKVGKGSVGERNY